MAIESFVSISSLSMLAIRTTMSSTSHSSYLRGRTLGGPWLGLARFGELGWLAATTESDGCADARSWDLRRLPGDKGLVRGSPGFSGDMFGSGGGSVVASGHGSAGATDAVVAVFAGCDILGPAWDGDAARRGTVGSNGSIGEYCVAASTPTYCFDNLACDEGDRSSAGDGLENDCLDWQRARGAITLGDFGDLGG